MVNESETPPGNFPRAIGGYAVGPVDDHLRKINAQLESLRLQVQEEIGRGDEGRRSLEQMTAEVETLRRKLIDSELREAAEIDARTYSDARCARLEAELTQLRENSRKDLESARDQARLERETLLAEERRMSAAQMAKAQDQAAQLKNETERLTGEVMTLRRLLEEARQTDPGATEPMANADSHRARLEAELEAQRVYARSRIEQLAAELRRNAEEAAGQAVSAYRAQEDRVRKLAAECEELISRLRISIETQADPTAAGIRPETPMEARPEATEIRSPMNLGDWRGAEWRARSDWRNAS